MNKNLAIIGAGGHGKVVGEIAILNNFKIIDFYDDKIKKKNFLFPIKGNLKLLKKNLKKYDFYFVAIGDNKIRKKIINEFNNLGLSLINLIHPKSTVSKFIKLGKGICIMANAVINPGSLIEDGVIVNSSASTDHDCKVMNFSHISPNCTLSGNVEVGELSHLGSATSVHPNVKIGSNVKTGVGSVVYKDIKKNSKYISNFKKN